MAVRAVVFDIGGVLEVLVDTGLGGRWERRLGLRPGEFFERLRRSGLGRDADLGRVSEGEFARALGRLYGLDPPGTEELLADLWDWYVGELNTELAAWFRQLRPRYRTALLSNAATGGAASRSRRDPVRDAGGVGPEHQPGGHRPGRVAGRLRNAGWRTRLDEVV
jgi:putative hydrolase of the HAD superfamily